MLDQLVASWSFQVRCRKESAHRVPLVIAREHRPRRFRLLVHLYVDERVEQLKPHLTRPDLLPQVGRARASRVDGVAFPAIYPRTVRPLVERQEYSLLAGQPGGHRHRVLIDREMHQRARGEHQILRVAVIPVLPDRVCHRLPRRLRFQLRRRHRQTINEQHQIHRITSIRLRMMHLARHHKPVRVEQLPQLRSQIMRRREERQFDSDAEVLHTPTQHIHCPARGDLGGETTGELVGRLSGPAMQADQLLPFRRLRHLNKTHHLVRHQPERS